VPLLERIVRERRPTSHSLIEGCSSIAEVAMQALEAPDQSQRKEWLHRARLANRALARLARTFPVGWPRYHYFQGRLLAHTGKTRAAQKEWRRGRQHAARLGMKHDLDQLDAVLGAVR
jgi:hypothetical protein